MAFEGDTLNGAGANCHLAGSTIPQPDGGSHYCTILAIARRLRQVGTAIFSYGSVNVAYLDVDSVELSRRAFNFAKFILKQATSFAGFPSAGPAHRSYQNR